MSAIAQLAREALVGGCGRRLRWRGDEKLYRGPMAAPIERGSTRALPEMAIVMSDNGVVAKLIMPFSMATEMKRAVHLVMVKEVIVEALMIIIISVAMEIAGV